MIWSGVLNLLPNKDRNLVSICSSYTEGSCSSILQLVSKFLRTCLRLRCNDATTKCRLHVVVDVKGIVKFNMLLGPSIIRSFIIPLLLLWSNYISNMSRQGMLFELLLSPHRCRSSVDDLLDGMWNISDQSSIFTRSDEVFHCNTRLVCGFVPVNWLGIELLLLWNSSKYRSIGFLMS